MIRINQGARNKAKVKFTNKWLDFCQIWLGEHKGPVQISYVIIDAWHKKSKVPVNFTWMVGQL